jgi:hypothetical protein
MCINGLSLSVFAFYRQHKGSFFKNSFSDENNLQYIILKHSGNEGDVQITALLFHLDFFFPYFIFSLYIYLHMYTLFVPPPLYPPPN